MKTALALSAWGAKIIGISDFTGGVYNKAGINVKDALAYIAANKSLQGYKGGDSLTNDELLVQPCTVLIPAALERVITDKNAGKLQCRLIAEGANGPTTNEADKIIAERGDIELIPDVLCNSGGVIVSIWPWRMITSKRDLNRPRVLTGLLLCRKRNFCERFWRLSSSL